MDVDTITSHIPAPGVSWQPGDAWLGGGTWLFSQPQPGLRRLLDLRAFGWPPLTESQDGLEIAATCTLAELARWRPAAGRGWRAVPLLRQCCEALLASFKVQNMATVGGNICLALPAGAMTSLAASLDGVATVWSPGGDARAVLVSELVTGPGNTALGPGDLLRSVTLPAASLRGRTAFRQASLSRLGRSAAVVIGRTVVGSTMVGSTGAPGLVISVSAATPRPVQLRFPGRPSPGEAVAALDRGGPDGAGLTWHDDMHGAPAWRAAMTRRFVAEVAAELRGDTAAEPGPPG